MAQQRQRQTVEVTPAKGRPFLHWVGKKPLERVNAFPAQLVESFNPTGEPGEGNLLFHGDNKEVLAYLLANGYRGKVNLIYIDPPFDSGADYVRKVELRGAKGAAKLDGETYTLGEQIQYTDIWANDNYLQFMYERLLLLKEMLGEDGNFLVHCDQRKVHHLRCLLDEVFGQDNFLNEIVWRRTYAGKTISKNLAQNADMILWYTKSDKYLFFPVTTALTEEDIAQFNKDDNDGRGRYATVSLQKVSGPTPGTAYDYVDNFGRVWKRPPKGWRMTYDKLKQLENEGGLYITGTTIRQKYYLNDRLRIGKQIDNIWDDIGNLNRKQSEILDYPTQKPEELLERIMSFTTEPGDLVLDCFIGSGTTAAVAQKLGRRWIGCDINKGAIQTTSKRLQTIILEQAQQQPRLVPEALNAAFLAFSIYRVNDYDLQMQHNEAINLACEHIGITRSRTDGFFDGTLGGRLVKVIPLTHPLTLLDLQLLKDELKNRPDEDRDIVIVCLGKETAVDPEVERWNKGRPVARIDGQGHPVAWQNRIEVIELRTDKRYGKFFTHQPARASVDIRRENGRIAVEVQDFISPTIIERLNMDQTLFKAQITDWRAMVDCVMIDTDYDGQVFNIAHSDVPPKKSDLVAGHYELSTPNGPTTVAVKIVDMLGEEVVVTAEV